MMFLSCKITIIASKSKALCWQYGRFESIKALMGKNEENQKMFGKSVILTEDYRLWWSYIPHFIHTPFY